MKCPTCNHDEHDAWACRYQIRKEGAEGHSRNGPDAFYRCKCDDGFDGLGDMDDDDTRWLTTHETQAPSYPKWDVRP